MLSRNDSLAVNNGDQVKHLWWTFECSHEGVTRCCTEGSWNITLGKWLHIFGKEKKFEAMLRRSKNGQHDPKQTKENK